MTLETIDGRSIKYIPGPRFAEKTGEPEWLDRGMYYRIVLAIRRRHKCVTEEKEKRLCARLCETVLDDGAVRRTGEL